MGLGSKIKSAAKKVTAPVSRVVQQVVAPVKQVVAPATAFLDKGFDSARGDLSRGFAGGKDQLRTGVGLLSDHTGIPSAFSSPRAPAPEEGAPARQWTKKDGSPDFGGNKKYGESDPYQSPPLIAVNNPLIKVTDPINAGLPASAFPTDNGAGTLENFLSTYASPPSSQGGQLPPSAFAQVDDAPVASAPTVEGFPPVLIVAIVAGVAIIAAVLVLKR